MQTADVENELRKRYSKLIEEFGKTKNPIWYVSKAGKHIKEKQVQELLISFGQIPDASGNVIPYTMEGNGFGTGINDPVSYYVAATGARLSAIMNKTAMGDAGYLSRNLILLSRTLTLSETMYDCGTKHRLKLKVIDSNFLHRLENRWYSETKTGELKILHYEECRHLIGKDVYIRSIVTCDGGDEVCHVCYGQDSHLVMHMPGMAVFNTEVYSEPVSQNILSTKHLLFTSANRLTFNESFSKYFRFNAGDIYLIEKDDWDPNISVESLYLRIHEDNVIPVNEQDLVEINTFGNKIESPFYIYDAIKKTYDKIEIINYESMFIDSSTIKLFKLVTDKRRPTGPETYYEISLEKIALELEGRILSIDIKNNGLTDNLYMIMNLLNKEAIKFDDYNALAQHLFEMLINANIRCRHVQGEIILNRLIRDINDEYVRPDFSKSKMPEYKILTLNRALINTKAPTIGLSYQEIRRQILSDDLYNVKDGSSYLDPMYFNEVKTSKLKALHEQLKLKRKQKDEENNSNGGV
jgi:hypothetical protein